MLQTDKQIHIQSTILFSSEWRLREKQVEDGFVSISPQGTFFHINNLNLCVFVVKKLINFAWFLLQYLFWFLILYDIFIFCKFEGTLDEINGACRGWIFIQTSNLRHKCTRFVHSYDGIWYIFSSCGFLFGHQWQVSSNVCNASWAMSWLVNYIFRNSIFFLFIDQKY